MSIEELICQWRRLIAQSEQMELIAEQANELYESERTIDAIEAYKNMALKLKSQNQQHQKLIDETQSFVCGLMEQDREAINREAIRGLMNLMERGMQKHVGHVMQLRKVKV